MILLGRVGNILSVSPSSQRARWCPVSLRAMVVPLAIWAALMSILSSMENETRAEEASETKPIATDIESTGPAYDHVLYVRHNEEDGSLKNDTLVLAKVTTKGLQRRYLYTRGTLGSRWKTLCVVGGKVYAMKSHNLLAIDTATGQAENLCSTIDTYTYASGRLYAVTRGKDSERVLRIFDLRGGAFRDVRCDGVEWPGQRIAVSPDHKRIAFFSVKRLEGTDPLPRSSAMLTVLELDAGTARQPTAPIHYMPPINNSLFTIGSPFVWLNSTTILYLRTAAPTLTSVSTNRLTAVNIFTGRTWDVCTVPGNPDFTRIHLEQESTGKVPYVRMMGPRITAGRHRIDVKAGKLVEDETIGGDFQLRGVEKSQGLYWREKKLGSVEGRMVAKVSPDGKRAIWFGGSPARTLEFFDSREAAVRMVGRDWLAGGLHWVSEEEIVPREQPSEFAKGWVPFADQSVSEGLRSEAHD